MNSQRFSVREADWRNSKPEMFILTIALTEAESLTFRALKAKVKTVAWHQEVMDFMDKHNLTSTQVIHLFAEHQFTARLEKALSDGLLELTYEELLNAK